MGTQREEILAIVAEIKTRLDDIANKIIFVEDSMTRYRVDICNKMNNLKTMQIAQLDEAKSIQELRGQVET